MTRHPRRTAIERVRGVLGGLSLEAFVADWEKRWLVERGVEIISEASRRLSEDLKTRHPEIPRRKIAGIGNIPRHNYEDVAAPIMWTLVRDELLPLEKVCRAELADALAREGKT